MAHASNAARAATRGRQTRRWAADGRAAVNELLASAGATAFFASALQRLE